MKVIQRQRGGGKTTEALRLFLNDPSAVFVCGSEAEARRVRDLVPKERRHRVIGVGNLPLRGSAEGFRIIVDNLEWVLRILMGAEVEVVTLTEAAKGET